MNQTENNRFIIDGKSLLVLFAGFIFTSILAQSIYFFFASVFGINLMKNNWFWLLINTLSFVLPIGAMYELCLKPKNQTFYFKLKINKTNYLIPILMMMFGLMLVIEFFISFIPTTGPVLGDWYNQMDQQFKSIAQDPIVFVLMVVVAAPILEEVFFRGVLLQGFINKGFSSQKAIFITSLIFGVIHANPWQLVGAGVLGIFLGWIYYKTNSLLYPILLHAFNNLISTIIFYFSNTENIFDVFNISKYMSLTIGCVTFIIFFIIFSRLSRKS